MSPVSGYAGDDRARKRHMSVIPAMASISIMKFGSQNKYRTTAIAVALLAQHHWWIADWLGALTNRTCGVRLAQCPLFTR
jgi:hypothetical protein